MPNPLPSLFRMRRMMQQRLGWFGGEASDQDGWMDGGWWGFSSRWVDVLVVRLLIKLKHLLPRFRGHIEDKESWGIMSFQIVFFSSEIIWISSRRCARYSWAQQKWSLLENFCLSQSCGRIERKSFYWPDSGAADANRSDDNHKVLRFWVNAPHSRQYLTLPPPKMFPSFPNVTYCHSKLSLHVKIVAKHW